MGSVHGTTRPGRAGLVVPSRSRFDTPLEEPRDPHPGARGESRHYDRASEGARDTLPLGSGAPDRGGCPAAAPGLPGSVRCPAVRRLCGGGLPAQLVLASRSHSRPPRPPLAPGRPSADTRGNRPRHRGLFRPLPGPGRADPGLRARLGDPAICRARPPAAFGVVALQGPAARAPPLGRVSSLGDDLPGRRSETVILELPDLLARLLPARAGGSHLRFVAVHHAKLVFLAFRDGAPDPEFVITVSSETEIRRLHDVLTRLHRTIPRLTAESLAIGRSPDGRFLQIQSAVPGMPWVSLAGSLRALHAAIDAVPPWHSRISPSGELRRQLDLCAAYGVALSTQALQFAESCAENLADLGELTCHWQHGDYCANNLMIAGPDVRIFDFDEFGLTAVPLHDDLALAFSVHEMAPADGASRPIAEDIRTCV